MIGGHSYSSLLTHLISAFEAFRLHPSELYEVVKALQKAGFVPEQSETLNGLLL